MAAQERSELKIMEYIETPDGQMQADFARRVGPVLLHYEAAIELYSFAGQLRSNFNRLFVADASDQLRGAHQAQKADG